MMANSLTLFFIIMAALSSQSDALTKAGRCLTKPNERTFHIVYNTNNFAILTSIHYENNSNAGKTLPARSVN